MIVVGILISGNLPILKDMEHLPHSLVCTCGTDCHIIAQKVFEFVQSSSYIRDSV